MRAFSIRGGVLVGAAAVLAAVATVAANASSSSKAAEAEKITVAIDAATNSTPVLIAKNKGFFAKHGLDATILLTPTGQQAIPALIRGDVQYVVGGALGIIQTQLTGLGPFKFVINMASVGASNPALGFIASPESGIKTPKDLPGHTVCLPAPGSLAQGLIQGWVKRAGGDHTKISWTVAPFAAMVEAIRTGKCDGAFAAPPFFSQGRALGLYYVGNPYFAFGPPGLPNNMLSTSAAYANANPASVKRFIAAMKEAITYSQRRPDEVRAAAAAFTGQDPAVLAASALPFYSAPIYLKSLQRFADLAAEVGYIQQSINTRAMVAAGAPVVKNK